MVKAKKGSAEMGDPIRICIVGTGGMARSHAQAFAEMDGVELVAGIDRNPTRLAEFCDVFGIEQRFTDLGAALHWGGFDAASNVTPDAVHHATTLPLLAAGKHVLCEKPLAANYLDAVEMADAAAAAGVINMVNLTYRNVAAMNEAARLVAEGAIGEVRDFEASYLQSWLSQPAWGHWDREEQWLWRLSTAHGSMGVLGDVGVHILDFATHVAGLSVTDVSCRLKTFDKAEGGKIGDYVLDANDSAVLHVGLENGAVGVVHATRYAAGHFNDLYLRIFGTKGALDVRLEKDKSVLRGCLGDDLLTANWVDLPAPDVRTNYQRFIDAIRAGQPVLPDFARGAALQQVLDLAVQSDGEAAKSLAIGSA